MLCPLGVPGRARGHRNNYILLSSLCSHASVNKCPMSCGGRPRGMRARLACQSGRPGAPGVGVILVPPRDGVEPWFLASGLTAMHTIVWIIIVGAMVLGTGVILALGLHVVHEVSQSPKSRATVSDPRAVVSFPLTEQWGRWEPSPFTRCGGRRRPSEMLERQRGDSRRPSSLSSRGRKTNGWQQPSKASLCRTGALSRRHGTCP